MILKVRSGDMWSGVDRSGEEGGRNLNPACRALGGPTPCSSGPMPAKHSGWGRGAGARLRWRGALLLPFWCGCGVWTGILEESGSKSSNPEKA